jgi:hypothetical protein
MPLPHRRRVRNVVICLLLGGLAAWIVPSYFSAERYRRRLESGLEQALHRPVKFGSLSFRLLPRPGFSVQNVEVGEDPDFGIEPFARVDQIDCDLRWHSLWRSHMDFSHLHLDHPDFNVVLNAKGNWNVEKLLVQTGVTTLAPPASAGNPRISAQPMDLDVDDARINFQVGLNKKAFALTDVLAKVHVDPSERQVQFQITASPFRSDLNLPTPGPVEVTGSWTPAADLAGPIDARVRANGALLYDWIPFILGDNPQVYGVMDSDIHITGSLANLAVEGDTNIAQLQRWGGSPPLDTTPLVLHYRGLLVRAQERAQVESLDASFGDSHLHFSGSADHLRSDPQWDCVLSLDRSRMEDILAMIRRFRPSNGAWNLKGGVSAMLSVKGSWREPQFGGYVGVQQASLETLSGLFPLSDISVQINNKGVVLAPAQITLAPHVALSAQGTIDRTKSGPRYDLQLSSKAMPLREAASLGSGLGVRALQAIGATGSISGNIHLTGSAWPVERPVVSAHAELRAARLLIPGLTEPLNLPRATLQINGAQIVADPIVAVMGTSVFTGRLEHSGGREVPWKFDIHATSLNLEQGALWFDALGFRPPLPLLQRIPGLSSFTAQREAASHIFDSLNAEGRFATPELDYRGMTLKDFNGTFALGSRQIRMKSAAFQAGGARGEAAGMIDFTATPPVILGQGSVNALAVQSLFARLPGPAHELRGLVSGRGVLSTRGLTREELAQNLTGKIQARAKDISFGSFDPLGSLAQNSHWGKLEPVRGPVTAAPLNLNLEISNRRIFLDPAVVDLSGAILQLQGSYAWTGAVDLNVRADLARVRRHWLLHDESDQTPESVPEVRLTGKIDQLVVNVPQGVVTESRARGEGVR